MAYDYLGYDEYDDRPSWIATILMILIAGVIATAVFDAFGQYYNKVFGYAQLAPTGLALASLKKLFGPELAPIRDVIGEGFTPQDIARYAHFLTGIVAYPLGYTLLARPIARAIIPSIPWWVLGAIYGVVLWVFALYVMAHLVAGNAPFLASADGSYPQITWVALAGHVAFGLTLAAVLRHGRRV